MTLQNICIGKTSSTFYNERPQRLLEIETFSRPYLFLAWLTQPERGGKAHNESRYGETTAPLYFSFPSFFLPFSLQTVVLRQGFAHEGKSVRGENGRGNFRCSFEGNLFLVSRNTTFVISRSLCFSSVNERKLNPQCRIPVPCVGPIFSAGCADEVLSVPCCLRFFVRPVSESSRERKKKMT